MNSFVSSLFSSFLTPHFVSLFCCSLLFLLFSATDVVARTMCVRATGQVICPTDPDRQFNISVQMFDKDSLPWEKDDLMGSSNTDENGTYTVEGCADDFGIWNNPDPYIRMMHRCPEPGHNVSVIRRYHIIYIDAQYLPNVTEVRTLEIDKKCGDLC